ncbi:hypothetical protein N7528_010226 [Penicillium herquei]|nr:hypothetical protein N7528_010226 [Penicillium herquei]
MIGEQLYVMKYVKALIETHPRFAYEALLYEYMFLHANPWAVAQGLRLACTNGNEALACAILIKAASVWRFPFTRCQSI